MNKNFACFRDTMGWPPVKLVLNGYRIGEGISGLTDIYTKWYDVSLVTPADTRHETVLPDRRQIVELSDLRQQLDVAWRSMVGMQNYPLRCAGCAPGYIYGWRMVG